MNKALKTAERKGFEAGFTGELEESCPYHDTRTGYRNNVTFSRAFRRAWEKGWKKGTKLRGEMSDDECWSHRGPHYCILCGYESDTTNVCRACPATIPDVEVTGPVFCEYHNMFHYKKVAGKMVWLSHKSVLMMIKKPNSEETKITKGGCC